jgi:hypothetical protein
MQDFFVLGAERHFVPRREGLEAPKSQFGFILIELAIVISRI